MELRFVKSVALNYNKVEVEISGIQPNEIKTARDVLDQLILDETNKLKAFNEEHVPVVEPKPYNKPSYPKKEYNTPYQKPQGQSGGGSKMISEAQIGALVKKGFPREQLVGLSMAEASALFNQEPTPQTPKAKQEQFNQSVVNKAPSGFDL